MNQMTQKTSTTWEMKEETETTKPDKRKWDDWILSWKLLKSNKLCRPMSKYFNSKTLDTGCCLEGLWRSTDDDDNDAYMNIDIIKANLK